MSDQHSGLTGPTNEWGIRTEADAALSRELIEIARAASQSEYDPLDAEFWIERCAVLEAQRDAARETAARYLQLLMGPHRVMFEVEPGVPGVVLSGPVEQP